MKVKRIFDGHFNLYNFLHCFICWRVLIDDTNVTHDWEELTILSFLIEENLLRNKYNNLQTLMFTQTQQYRKWNAFFHICSFAFNTDFDTKHVQLLINKSFSNFCGKDIEADSLTVFLRLCR